MFWRWRYCAWHCSKCTLSRGQHLCWNCAWALTAVFCSWWGFSPVIVQRFTRVQLPSSCVMLCSEGSAVFCCLLRPFSGRRGNLDTCAVLKDLGFIISDFRLSVISSSTEFKSRAGEISLTGIFLLGDFLLSFLLCSAAWVVLQFLLVSIDNAFCSCTALVCCSWDLSLVVV